MNVMGHRGFSSRAPENTLAAFQQAIDYGCQWIELDVQLTADNVVVVIHDQTIDRCTDGSGTVSAMTLAQLRQYDAGSWFGPEYHQEKIPTFEETVQLAKQHGIHLNVELKPYPGDDEQALCEGVAQVLSANQIAPDTILFSSFSVSALQTIKRVLPNFRRGLLWETMPDNAFDCLSELEAYSVHCDYLNLSESQAKAIKQQGYHLYCYTPNQPDDVFDYWQWGVDMMITDCPDRYASAA